MASGHVNRENKAEHMAAPHRNLQRDDSPCQFGAVHTWPFCDMARELRNDRFQAGNRHAADMPEQRA